MARLSWFGTGSSERGRALAEELRKQRGLVGQQTRVLKAGDAMTVLIHRHSAMVRGADGATYSPSIYAESRSDGTWMAWIEFDATDGSRRRLRTGQETSQPDRAAVEYWAGGLEPVYFEGALGRATPIE